MFSYITIATLALPLALPQAVALSVYPAVDDKLGISQGWLDLVSSFSSWALPSRRPIRSSRTNDNEKERLQQRIREVHPSEAHGQVHKGWPYGEFFNHVHRARDGQIDLVSGWVLVHGLGNHTNVVQAPQLEKLTRAVRDSMSDALDTCRQSVTITEARSINVKLLEESLHVPQGSSLIDRTRGGVNWLFGHQPAAHTGQVNLTQVKIWYEVRIFPEMKATQDEMATRMDALQIYGRFADAGKQLSQAFVRTNVDFGPIIVLDDLGYAARDKLVRPPLSKDALLDCAEEMLLRDARVFHQWAVAAALLVAAFTACAGSAVFSIKQHSHIPSRFNMLSRDNGILS